jgi:predicted anti-sigma-YlaC factor YlaD
MECDEVRTAVSASIDGDAGPSNAVAAHLAECAECRLWEERAHTLSRRTLRPAEEVSLPTPPGVPRGFARNRWLRVALAWGGVLLIVWNASAMVAPGGDPGSVHLARHQAAFSAALGLTYLVVAWRPERAYGLVPFAAIFTFTLAATGVVDILRGTSTAGAESRHLVEIAGLAVLLVLGIAAGPGRRPRRTGANVTTPPSSP